MTALAPCIARLMAAASVMSPTMASSTSCVGARSKPRTRQPRLLRPRTAARPMQPAEPVTRTIEELLIPSDPQASFRRQRHANNLLIVSCKDAAVRERGVRPSAVFQNGHFSKLAESFGRQARHDQLAQLIEDQCPLSGPNEAGLRVAAARRDELAIPLHLAALQLNALQTLVLVQGISVPAAHQRRRHQQAEPLALPDCF